MATELNAESTHEDIQEYVDKIVSDVAVDRAGEDDTDSQKVASDSDKPTGDMTAETDSGSDDTAEGESTEGEKTGSDDQSNWLDDDLKAEVAAYGIDEKELADFTSREELERALRFFDRSAMEAGRKALAEGEDENAGNARDEQGRFKKQDVDEEEPEGKDGQYEIGLDKDVYDEDVVNEFTRMRDHYDSRLEALESRLYEADARAEEQLFDSIVDALGHTDLFGKAGKESAKQLQHRQDLHIAVKAQQIGLQSLGRPTDLDESLVGRVTRMVFAEDLGKKDLISKTRKISKQADKRQGGSATRATDPPETVREEMRRLYKELDSGTP
jgi:hypothetical protein